MPAGDFWSIPDVAVSLVSALRTAAWFWDLSAEYGDGELFTELAVPGATPFLANAPHGVIGFGSLYYDEDLVFDQRAFLVPSLPEKGGSAAVSVNYGSLMGRKSELVWRLLNQLLRCLGYSADREKLTREIELVVERRGG